MLADGHNRLYLGAPTLLYIPQELNNTGSGLQICLSAVQHPQGAYGHLTQPVMLLRLLLFSPSQLRDLMKEGKLKVTIEKVFLLSQADKAHELSEAGHVRGKVVLQVADL